MTNEEIEEALLAIIHRRVREETVQRLAELLLEVLRRVNDIQER